MNTPNPIPQALTSVNRWLNWKYEMRKGKLTKVPYCSIGGEGSTTDPRTWSVYESAKAAAARHDGIGWVFSEEDDIMGIDLDHCRDPDTGEIEPWAAAVVLQLNSYTEESPSGTGLHIFIRARLDTHGRKGERVEIYQTGRYFTVTGKPLPGFAGEIATRQSEAEAILAEFFPIREVKKANGPAVSATAPTGADWEIVDWVRKDPKYDALWRGDIAGYPSHSEADLALAGRIAFFVGPDGLAVDRVFRQSGLWRDKWDEQHGGDTYGGLTIATALLGKMEFFRWREKAAVPSTRAAEETDPERAPIHLTDMGNGTRFAFMHRGRAHYSLAHGWLVYDGKRWTPDPLAAVELAKATVRAMYGEAELTVDETARKSLAGWAFKSEENKRVQAMLTLARSESGIRIDGGVLDQQPWLFNVINGTIDLRTGVRQDHAPHHLITQLSPVAYDAAAPCPCFRGVLLEMMAGRQELVDYLQRWFGQCLSGSVQMQELLFLFGMGANGKNTLMECIQGVLGEYATTAPQDLLIERKHEAHTQEIASLMGKRLVVADETEQGRRFNEAQLKRLTGGGQLKGHFMRQNDIEFWPQFKIALMANHKPIIRGTDDAIWRRLRLVPFDVKFHDPESGNEPIKDTTLSSKLKAELPGILAWLVDGCRSWVESGYRLIPPEVVRRASASYRQEMDTLGDFLAQCCTEHQGATVQSSVLHEAYLAWCARHHEPPLKQRSFSTALLERGYRSALGGPRSKVSVWLDMALVETAEEPDSDEGQRWR